MAEQYSLMSSPSEKAGGKRGKKVRVPFRPNRSTKRRDSNWTRKVRDAGEQELDTDRSESVSAKGALSRRRTIIETENGDTADPNLHLGTVLAVRGLFADVDDGAQIWSCTVRRVLRTRMIKDRHPVTVGDRVRFRVQPNEEGVAREGVIEAVEPRRGELKRRVRNRIHTIVANVDQAIVVSSARQPKPKPHLIDRYLVAAGVGEIAPVICMNKIDLDEDGMARDILAQYAQLGYGTICTSVVDGEGVDELRDILRNKENVFAGQSGVGKSSLLNVIQPGLELKVGKIVDHTDKGRHTTTTACLIRLEIGGYVVDTPGVKSFDLSAVGRHEIEAHFIEFLDHIPHCKFPDCAHTHEIGCAVKGAVEREDIRIERYDSYVRLFEESESRR